MMSNNREYLEEKAAELEGEAREAFEAGEFTFAGAKWGAALLARRLSEEEARRVHDAWVDRKEP